MKTNRTNNIETVQVSFVKTIVGWFNVYLAGTERYVTMNPDEFKSLLPDITIRVRYGCGEIDRTCAQNYFGEKAVSQQVVA
ncbi:hypothetical protein RGU11_06625 [Rossellomorea marisflavi]|uniref:hypothetical protein n=1 Tax=Rossellomorea marisflavi TaxID=189381 RepID=UPI0028533E8B|nr:hypothetical protein [Rossellomorea marisflavi]MDR4936040.1 hypothetical protein [Rossellomorea marisflavi]